MSAQEVLEHSPSQPQTRQHQEPSTTPFSLRAIQPDNLGRWWPAVAHQLIAPLSYADDGTTLKEIRESLEKREAMLWVGHNGSDHVVTMVLAIENGALFAWLVAGERMDEWIDEVMAAMRRYAREFKLTHIKSVVRPGLARKLRKKGWRTTAEIVKAKI